MSELRSLVDERERKLLETIEKHRNEQEKKLCIQKEGLEYLLESMTHACEFTSHLLDHGNPVEILATSQAVLSRFATLLSSPIVLSQQPKGPILEFKEPDKKEKKQDIQTILSSLGQVIFLGSSQEQLLVRQIHGVAFFLSFHFISRELTNCSE